MAGEFSPAADPPRTPTVLATYRSPINTVAGRIIADVSDEIPFYEPSAAPLCLFFRGLKKKRVATQRRFDHFEKDVNLGYDPAAVQRQCGGQQPRPRYADVEQSGGRGGEAKPD